MHQGIIIFDEEDEKIICRGLDPETEKSLFVTSFSFYTVTMAFNFFINLGYDPKFFCPTAKLREAVQKGKIT